MLGLNKLEKPVKALENMRESGKMNFIQKTLCNSQGL